QPVGVYVGGGNRRKCSDQARRIGTRGSPLVMAQVTSALGSYLAIGKILCGCPFYGIISVICFIPKRIPLAFTFISPPYILNDTYISSLGKFDHSLMMNPFPLHSIRGSGKDHRIFSRFGG